MADPMTPEQFLREVAEITGLPQDEPARIVRVLKRDRVDDERFHAWAQDYLERSARPSAGSDLGDAIRQELLARDEEVKRLRAALSQIANWPQDEMYTSLAPAVGMKAIAKDALAGEEVTHG
jgi:hypothetical protein